MFNLYDYNTRSEVVDAVRYFHPYSVENVGGQVGSSTNSTENPVGLQDWSYSYDNIGNRTGTTKANAAGNYTVNALNQYTERTVPDSSDIIGSAETNVTVTVNTNTATRQDYYWYHRLEVDNLYTAAYPQVVVEAVFDPGTNDPYVVSSETGNVFVAESPESFTYDDDGNLLSDGRFEYTWDAENRLISATTTTNLPADVPIVHVAFDYDYQSRRTAKTVYEWDEGITNWTETASSSFTYDGWNLISEQISNQTSTITNSYVWGPDLSGSLQGAGGIGGLLSVVKGTNAYFPTFDGNGNVSEYVDASGEIAAHYEYSPFGETIVATGPNASEFLHRFSTKPTEDNTGLVLYEYRPYSPSLGRFLNSDPIGEKGGLNLYRFAENEPINLYDKLGLESCNQPGQSRWMTTGAASVCDSGKWTDHWFLWPNVEFTLATAIAMGLYDAVLNPGHEETIIPAQWLCYCYKKDVKYCTPAREEKCVASSVWIDPGYDVVTLYSWLPTGKTETKTELVEYEAVQMRDFSTVFVGTQSDINTAYGSWLQERYHDCKTLCASLSQ